LKTSLGRDEGRDPFMTEMDSIEIAKNGGVLELRVASVMDVLSSRTVESQVSTTAITTASISPEVLTVNQPI